MQGVKARQSIPVIPFRLDKNSLNAPTKFEFEIRCGNKDYLYGFEVDHEKVHSEWLHLIKKTTTSTLFERKITAKKKASFEFDEHLFETKKDAEFLEFIARGTRENQLFLTESIDREVKYFEEIYNWFSRLVIIFPETRYQIELNVNSKKTNAMVKYLGQVGTGVCGFGLKSVSLEKEFPKEMVDDMKKELKPGDQMGIMESSQVQRYVVSKNDKGELVTSKFMLRHKMIDFDEEILFDTNEEF